MCPLCPPLAAPVPSAPRTRPVLRRGATRNTIGRGVNDLEPDKCCQRRRTKLLPDPVVLYKTR